jgi:EpsI family protein
MELLQGLTLALFYLLLYGFDLSGFVKDWSENSVFSYGFLVPLFTALLVWSKRSVLATTPIRPSEWGLLLLMPAVAMEVAGRALGDDFTVRVSMIMTLAALVILFLGREQFKVLRYPLGYLFLMIPWPYTFLKPIIDGLRLSNAIASGLALSSMGIPVTRDAYLLRLPNIILEVADGCSGVQSAFALVAVAGVYACFLRVRPALKLSLIGGAVPIAVLANLVRIIVTAALAYRFGAVVFQTTLHAFSGVFTFLVGLALLIALGETLQRRHPSLSEPQLITGQPGEPVSTRARTVNVWPGLLFAAGLFCLAFYVGGSLEVRGAVPEAQLQSLPARLGPYQPWRFKWTNPYQDDNAVSSISHIYKGDDGAPIELFVGCGRPSGKDHLRSPRMVFPRNWNYVSDESAPLPLSSAAVNGKWMLIGNGTTRQLVYYWYEMQGRSFSSEWRYRLSTARNALAGRNDAAVIRIATAFSKNESLELAKERLAKFIEVFYPELRAVLPD